MSKRELKKYLHSLSKENLEEQILDLYSKFKNVKVYYDFVFNPNEEKLVEACKFKIRKEYFPPRGRKAKARRSVAQKYIRHFRTIGMDPLLIADIMLFNIETAQQYAAIKPPRQEAFYISMFRSFQEAVSYIAENKLNVNFSSRINKIAEEVQAQQWFNSRSFQQHC